MLYLRADKLSDIQDAFNPNPLEEPDEIEKYYQDTTEARTGDIYSSSIVGGIASWYNHSGNQFGSSSENWT